MDKLKSKQGTTFIVVGFLITVASLKIISTDNDLIRYFGASMGMLISCIGVIYNFKKLNKKTQIFNFIVAGATILSVVIYRSILLDKLL